MSHESRCESYDEDHRYAADAAIFSLRVFFDAFTPPRRQVIFADDYAE